MEILNSYRITVFLLLAAFAMGIYTLITFSNSSETEGSVFNEEGLIINKITDEPYTGRVVDTISNKIISYDVKNGLKNGDFAICYLNGKKAVTGKMTDNKNDGKWYYYYDSGEIESMGYFKNDIVMGEWIWYYKNGNKSEEGEFVNGKREGLWKSYNEDGTLKVSVFFSKGDEVSSFNVKSHAAS